LMSEVCTGFGLRSLKRHGALVKPMEVGTLQTFCAPLRFNSGLQLWEAQFGAGPSAHAWGVNVKTSKGPKAYAIDASFMASRGCLSAEVLPDPQRRWRIHFAQAACVLEPRRSGEGNLVVSLPSATAECILGTDTAGFSCGTAWRPQQRDLRGSCRREVAERLVDPQHASAQMVSARTEQAQTPQRRATDPHLKDVHGELSAWFCVQCATYNEESLDIEWRQAAHGTVRPFLSGSLQLPPRELFR